MVGIPPQEICDTVTDIIREAGVIIKNAHNVDSADDIEVKPGTANFVTVFDVKVQDFLISRLTALFPGAHFLSEEKENRASDTESGLCFVIDPIDGTTNFIHDMRASSISVGMLHDGIPVFGAVYDPYTGSLYSARRGHGAFLGDSPIRCSERSLSAGLVMIGTSPYYRDTWGHATFQLAEELFQHCADVRRGGSAALDICSVACGRAEAFYEFRLSPWDYCAGALILSEAGGFAGTMAGSPLGYGDGSSVLCTNAASRDEVLALTKKYADLLEG